MPYYRLYHLDPHTGHINAAEEIFAADDVAATHDLQCRRSDHPLELWLGGRKVVRVDAMPIMAAAVPVLDVSRSLHTARGTRFAWRSR